MKFIADSMLGRLATWLRIMGYDTLYFPNISDPDLVNIALRDNRVILTRDTLLIKRRRVKTFVFIEKDHYKDQLYQVVKELKLDSFSRFLTRCLRCNDPLEDVEKEKVQSTVPPYVFETQDKFKVCPGCKRIYWGATHVGEMKKKIESILQRGL